MYYLRFNNDNKIICFKNRNKFKKKKFIFIFGSSMIISFKSCRFEPSYFSIFRKFIKNIVKTKNSTILKKNYWIFLKLNTPITKKSKNSRMGKGKGSLYKWVVRLSSGFKIIEFKDLNSSRLKKLVRAWSKKINIPLTLHTKIAY